MDEIKRQGTGNARSQKDPRKKGEGTRPRLRSDGRWVCQAQSNGKRKYFYAATDTAASKAMRAWLRSPEAANAKHIVGHLTVNDLMDSWLARKKKSTKDKTYFCYESVVRVHVKPRIGNLKPEKVTGRHITALLHDMECAVKTGRKEGSTDLVGARTRELAYIAIGAAFKMISPDILDNVQKPKGEREEMHPWDPAEAKRFLTHVEQNNDEHAALYRLALTSGLRKGEILALTIADIDLRTGHVSVTKTWNDKTLRSTTPKTKTSRRTVVIPERTRQAVRAYIMATGRRGDSRIFTPEVRNLAKAMKKAMKAAAVPEIRFHDLRHTYATLALGAGVPVKVVSESLGHAGVGITLDCYAHVMPGQAESAAAAVDAAIS
ncbi:MAG: site-specific integrase [Candidatus Tyrphobacter sp.]